MESITNEEIEAVIRLDEQSIIRCIPEGIPALHRKVEAAFPSTSRNHVVPCSDYDTVYVTSDIHSDLRKFVQILLLNKLLRITDGRALNPYDDDSLFTLDWISQVEWTGGERTLFVIVGDLVDGRREHTFQKADGSREVFVNNPDDSSGAFELLLLILIYNLRLSAREQHSEILFTMGNHEMVSVILPSIDTYDRFVSPYARLFYGDVDPFLFGGTGGDAAVESIQFRKAVLMPFLHMSPYYMIRMDHGGTPEIACVHGGLQGAGLAHLEALEELQQRINRPNGSLEMIHDSPLLEGYNGPLWLRNYSTTPGGACGSLTPSPLLTIVGHCVTESAGYPRFTELLRKPIYSGCEERDEIGCVLMDCEESVGGPPRLLFVDTGSGKSQRSPSYGSYKEVPNELRHAQIIKCTHHEELTGERYFNQIERVARKNEVGISESGLDVGTTLLYKALPKAMGFPPPAGASVGAPPSGFTRRFSAEEIAMKLEQQNAEARTATATTAAPSRPRLPAEWGLPAPAAPSRPRLPVEWGPPVKKGSAGGGRTRVLRRTRRRKSRTRRRRS